MAPHSSTLAWKIPGRGSLVGCRLRLKRLGGGSGSGMPVRACLVQLTGCRMTITAVTAITLSHSWGTERF